MVARSRPDVASDRAVADMLEHLDRRVIPCLARRRTTAILHHVRADARGKRGTHVTHTSAFTDLVQRCGLSAMFARHAMTRAVLRAGLSPESMSARDVEAVLPEVERAITPFLAAAEGSLSVGRLARSRGQLHDGLRRGTVRNHCLRERGRNRSRPCRRRCPQGSAQTRDGCGTARRARTARSQSTRALLEVPRGDEKSEGRNSAPRGLRSMLGGKAKHRRREDELRRARNSAARGRRVIVGGRTKHRGGGDELRRAQILPPEVGERASEAERSLRDALDGGRGPEFCLAAPTIDGRSRNGAFARRWTVVGGQKFCARVTRAPEPMILDH